MAFSTPISCTWILKKEEGLGGLGGLGSSSFGTEEKEAMPHSVSLATSPASDRIPPEAVWPHPNLWQRRHN